MGGPNAVHPNRTSPPKIDLRGRNYKIIESENSQRVSHLTHTEPEPEPEPEPDMGVTKEQVESSLKSKMNPSHLVSPNSIFFFFFLASYKFVVFFYFVFWVHLYINFSSVRNIHINLLFSNSVFYDLCR